MTYHDKVIKFLARVSSAYAFRGEDGKFYAVAVYDLASDIVFISCADPEQEDAVIKSFEIESGLHPRAAGFLNLDAKTEDNEQTKI